MTAETRDILAAAGLDVDVIGRLIAKGELSSRSDAACLLDAAVAAAGDPGLLPTALPRLLAALEARAPGLGDYEQGVLHHLQGVSSWRLHQDVPVATCAFHRSLDRLDRAGTVEAKGYAGRVADSMGQLLQREGLLVDARGQYERALAIKAEVGDEAGAALTQGNLGRLCHDLGAYPEAARHLAADLAHVERVTPELTRVRSQLATELGACLTALGEHEKAQAQLERGLALARTGEDPIGTSFALVYLGRLALARGDQDGAAGAAREVRSLLTLLPDGIEDIVQGLLGQLEAMVAWAAGDVEEALARFTEAATRFEAMRDISPVEHAELLATWADALCEAGRDREAARRLRAALRLLDTSTAEDVRARIDARLHTIDESAWMLHGAGRFVGHEQIELLLGETGRAGFRGREEDVTVLFSDLRGFTALTEGLAPDVLIATLNRYLALMTRCIEQFGGYVDKFIGDAVMAVFSLPTPAADDAERAISAALYMGIELDRMNRSLPDGVPRFAAGVGLHAGSVVAGLIGSPRKRAYTVIGDVVNTASRLEGMTKQLGAPVLVTGEVKRRLPENVRWPLLPLGTYRPKGRQAAVDVWGVLGPDDEGDGGREPAGRVALASEALHAFRARDFREAQTAFDALATGGPAAKGAKGYALHAAAARELERKPPPDDWDGAIVLTEK